jgi:hypothetical protein
MSWSRGACLQPSPNRTETQMNRAIAGAVAALAIGGFTAACGGSASPPPTHAALLETFGDTAGSNLTARTAATPRLVVYRLGDSWLLQVCQEKSDAALQGVTAARAEGYFARGYDATAPADAPSAKTVFGQISRGCTTEGF